MNRSNLLDSLRILAILLVFIAHIGQLLGHSSGDFFGWENIYFVSLGGVGLWGGPYNPPSWFISLIHW